jgi:predicted dehydrogenase
MSDKLKFGVIGAGRMGTNHAKVISKRDDVEFVGICDTNTWRAQIAAWRCGGMAFNDYKDLLSKTDAVVVAVPTELHYEVGMAALEAGVHTLIEKPIASNVDEARKLLERSEERGVQLQVGHVERFNPAVLAAIEHIHEPRFLTVERLGPYDPRMSGIGVVLDLMIHDLDILLTLVDSKVTSLEALGASLVSKHEDIANVRVRFENGCVADLTASRISLKRCRKIRIFQGSSYISLDYLNASLDIYRKKRPDIKNLLKDVERVTPRLTRKGPLDIEIDHFVECIRHNRKPWPSGEHGIEALKLALQITEELQKYEVRGHAGSASFLPRLGGAIRKAARSVKETLQPEQEEETA